MGHSMLKSVRITPNIYLGGSFTKRQVKNIKNWGITAVVSIRIKTPPVGITTLHLPTIDNGAPTEKDLLKGIDFINKEIKKGGKVYVHCREGIGRGPTMVIAYLISKGYKLNEAIYLLKQVRKFINPTKKQLSRLESFSKKIS
jgi:dual specificity MAP kinase phosphatase